MAIFTSKAYINVRKIYYLAVCVKTLQDNCFQALRVAFKFHQFVVDFATECNLSLLSCYMVSAV